MDTFRRYLSAKARNWRDDLFILDSLSLLKKTKGSLKLSNFIIEEVFQTWRLQFCEDVATKLPKELRVEVYKAIFGPPYSFGPNGPRFNLSEVEHSNIKTLFSASETGQSFSFELKKTVQAMRAV